MRSIIVLMIVCTSIIANAGNAIVHKDEDHRSITARTEEAIQISREALNEIYGADSPEKEFTTGEKEFTAGKIITHASIAAGSLMAGSHGDRQLGEKLFELYILDQILEFSGEAENGCDENMIKMAQEFVETAGLERFAGATTEVTVDYLTDKINPFSLREYTITK